MKKLMCLLSVILLCSCNNIISSSSSSTIDSSTSMKTISITYEREIHISEMFCTLDFEFGVKNAKYNEGKYYASCSLCSFKIEDERYDFLPKFHVAGDYRKLEYTGEFVSTAEHEFGKPTLYVLDGAVIDLEYNRINIKKIDDVSNINIEYIIINTKNEFIPIDEYKGNEFYISYKDETIYGIYSFDPLII
ncbi:MAG: hypothetical protein IJV94_01420 [Bacilli bacterium]|nr:hypothetical protein [Bacilli bacterium]